MLILSQGHSSDKEYTIFMDLYFLVLIKIKVAVINLMNQTALRQRKSSVNRLSTINSSSKARKKLSSTKKSNQVQETCHQKQSNKYLIGWGKVPFLESNANSVQIINKDIACFSAGQQHIIFMNSKGQAYGVGSNQYGQLGARNNTTKSIINRVFEEVVPKQIYCTEYSTFIVNNENQLFACGLNSRGQLGFGPAQMKVGTLRLVDRLSEWREQQLKRKNSRSRISSVYYQELKRESLDFECNENADNIKNSSLLENQEYIIDIRGGPLHTIVLTSKGRLFYSGNFYKTSSLLDDGCTFQFIELNTSKIGKIVSIRSYVTGFAFLSQQGQLFVLGIFGSWTYDEPYSIKSRDIIAFDVNDSGVYFADSYGELYFSSFQKEHLKGQRISLGEKIRFIHCGIDFCIAVTAQRTLLGKGDNSQKQLTSQNQSSYTNFYPLEVSIGEEQIPSIKCSNNFVLALTSQPPSLEQKGSSSSNITKVKDIQRQNKILKQLLCSKNKKSVKVQTDKQSKFDIVRPINARTFDTSLEIPFQQLKLGKQISEGGYGIIYKATWRKSPVAVKIFKIQKDNENAIRDFVSQCHAMQALRHPNIVMFLGACTKPPHFAIVLEFCEGGTLWSLLQKQDELGWEQRRKLAINIALGMNYLHQRSVPVLHRDLKSLNVLLDHNRRVKLADFGWTKGLQNYMTGKIGTYQWMAPEVISGYQYTEKADVFSYGIILWQIASREAPYRNIPGPQVAQDVLNKDLRPIIPKKTPQQFAELIRVCWSKNPECRPSFVQIIDRLETMRLG